MLRGPNANAAQRHERHHACRMNGQLLDALACLFRLATPTTSRCPAARRGFDISRCRNQADISPLQTYIPPISHPCHRQPRSLSPPACWASASTPSDAYCCATSIPSIRLERIVAAPHISTKPITSFEANKLAHCRHNHVAASCATEPIYTAHPGRKLLVRATGRVTCQDSEIKHCEIGLVVGLANVFLEAEA